MGYKQSAIFNDCTTVQEQNVSHAGLKINRLQSLHLCTRTKSQPWGIQNQPFLMTAPLCKKQKSAMLDKRSTIYNHSITVQEQKSSHAE